MDVGDFLKSFAIDTWYKALLYLGGVVLAVSFFVEVKGLTNQQLQLLAGGAFLIGLGEWKNHKVASWIKPPNVYTGGPALMTAKIREADFVGVVLDLAGVILIVLGIVRIGRG
ncbi:MAG TPA: hypothetical protein PKJ41_03105 [Bryobacteraceae bacterium]|nr:hypothetical protein [Bryobacteraceae bacterium]HPT28469.1 hypothetical protein [Bryobacteraceae bacterium]